MPEVKFIVLLNKNEKRQAIVATTVIHNQQTEFIDNRYNNQPIILCRTIRHELKKSL